MRRADIKRSGAIELEIVSCAEGELGRTAGPEDGQSYPFIVRRYARDQVLCTAGDDANHVWFVTEGVVGLSRSRSEAGEVHALRLPGSYVGLECLVSGSYVNTARALSHCTLYGATREGFLAWLRQSDERVATVMRAVLEELFSGLGRRAGRVAGATES
jgi:CRP-like cAMP-binding protein